MKDDLIKILNYKLKQIRDNIDSLNSLNDKIDKKTDELNFVKNAIKNFEGNEQGFDIYRFSNIDRETFNKLLMNLSSDVLTKFGTDSCNYDGLIYLINGINSGISLTLTQEQIDAINLFIDKLLEKEKDYQDVISLLNEEKQKLNIKNLDVLNELENKYSLIIENIDDGKYVVEIDEIVDAINYSNLDSENAFDILCYLLKYNSRIYNIEVEEINKREKDEINLSEKFDEEFKSSKDGNEENKETVSFDDTSIDEDKKDDKDEIEIDLSFDNVEVEDGEKKNNLDFSVDSFDVSKKEDDETTNDLDVSLNVSDNLEIKGSTETESNDKVNVEFEDSELEYNPILPSWDKDGYFNSSDLDIPSFDEFSGQKIDVVLPTIDLDLPIDDKLDEINLDENEEKEFEFDTGNEDKIELPEITFDVNDTNSQDSNIKDDVKKIELEINEDDSSEKTEFNSNDSVEENEDTQRDKLDDSFNLDSNELKSIFENYGFEFDDIDDISKKLLLKGNLEQYHSILAKLDELNVFKYLKNNLNIMVQLLLYSNSMIMDEILKIVNDDLSVDEEDEKMTFEIICKTMPSVFIKGENGNYENFVKNISSLKEFGIDLINLFDFSREVLIADNQLMINNYKMVSTYDLTVNAYNAKYLLLLSNISSRIDYYVEAIYKDNSNDNQKQVFDGIEMIKLYPNKLNTVNAETIKRLRYASENGLKLFGSKEKSLSSEITNLNVNRIEMTDNYLKSLFNNEFDIIPRDEFYKYVSLVNTNEYVDFNQDKLLNKLDVYKNGLRYFIGNINVSTNKVIRNYNILINNGVDSKKALLFAICYNLVITKTEYEKIKSFVDNLGGI